MSFSGDKTAPQDEQQQKQVDPTGTISIASTQIPAPLTSTTIPTNGAYRETVDQTYNSESDEDYDPALDSSSEDDDDENDEMVNFVDETTDNIPEAEANAGKVLDDLVDMFVQNTGRAPTEEEMQEWMDAMKSLMVGGDVGLDRDEGSLDKKDCKSLSPAAE